MRFISDDERRARLARRHGFLASPGDLAALADRLVGLHSTDPVTVFLAAASRHVVDSVTETETALYEERSCLRMLGMRRTLFVVPVADVATVQRAYTDAFVQRERRRFAGWLEGAGVADDGARHIDTLTDLALEFFRERGEASTRELTSSLPRLDERFTPPVSGAGPMSVGSRVVLLMTAAGLLARSRPLGTWISGQYRYMPMDTWLGEPIPALEPATARARLARRWLTGYGPGTLRDLQWWTGWNLGQTRAALAAVGAVEVELESGTGFVAPDDVDPVASAEPWVALLAGLDSTPMGWKDRDWYLGEHATRLFDRNGNVGPTVWWNGRIVGGWAQRPSGEIAVEYLEEVPPDCVRRVHAETERLTAFVGDTRFTPRFRTPLERELAS